MCHKETQHVTKREVHLSGKSGRINTCIYVHARPSGWQFLPGFGGQVCTGFAAKMGSVRVCICARVCAVFSLAVE